MRLDRARVVPLQPVGTGRLGRFEGAICLVGDDPTRVATAALFDACRNHQGDGASLIQKVAGILTRAAGATLPPFAIVAQDGEALLVAVHGSVTILAEQPGGPLRLGGGEAGTWASSRVVDTAYLSAVTGEGQLGLVPSLVDLHRGVAVADSFVVLAEGVSPGDVQASEGGGAAPAPRTPAAPSSPLPSSPSGPLAPPAPRPAPTASPPPPPPPASPPAPPMPQPFAAGQGEAEAVPAVAAGTDSGASLGFASLPGGAFKIVELRPPTPPPQAPPLPVAQPQHLTSSAGPAAGVAHDETPARLKVRGVHCGRGHFNDPRARFCAVCGLAMFQNSVVLSEGERPPLGVLLLSNGESFPLTTNLVIGREPFHHGQVLDGSAEALVPTSKGPSLSRVHAQIRLEGWDVHLVDEGSTNGSYVWDEARRQWIRLVAQQPYVLRPGDQIALGELTATFETSLQQ